MQMEKKHGNLVSARLKNADLLFFEKSKTDKGRSSKVIEERRFFVSKKKECVNKCKKLHKGGAMDCDINENALMKFHGAFQVVDDT